MIGDKASGRRAQIGRALRRGFRDAYDHLGYVVLVSLVGFAVSGGLFGAGLSAAKATRPGLFLGSLHLLPAALAAYLAAVGVFYYANMAVYHEHPSLADTLSGIKRLFLPAVTLFAADVVITSVLAVDTMVLLSMKGNPILLVLAVVCGYLLIVWLTMLMYHLPLLPAQLRMESGPRTGVILRKSFLLTADNPGFTVGLFLAIIAFAVLCALPALLGAAMFFLGAVAFVLTHALRELFIKYGIVEEEPDVAEDAGWPR